MVNLKEFFFINNACDPINLDVKWKVSICNNTAKSETINGIREGSPSVFVTFEQTQWKYDKKF